MLENAIKAEADLQGGRIWSYQIGIRKIDEKARP